MQANGEIRPRTVTAMMAMGVRDRSSRKRCANEVRDDASQPF